MVEEESASTSRHQNKTLKRLKELEERLPGKMNPINTWRGFSQFLSQYGILTLAVGVVIGTAVNALIQAIVADLVTPLISLLTPGARLQNLTITVHSAVFKVGAALEAMVTFLVIAFLVYFLAKFILRNEELLQKK